MIDKSEIKVIGLMSGTSLDGVDVAACGFVKVDGRWSLKLYGGKTLPYDAEMLSQLKDCHNFSARDLAVLNVRYGEYLGDIVDSFVKESGFEPQFVASHGYTVFHEPQNRMTMQIGSGAHIMARCGLPVVCDFRTTDVALGGNGAPLVPIGDRLLFGNYSACLNIGGFANVSYDEDGIRKAFDICPANIVLNGLARRIGLEFDADGAMARRGTSDADLLARLNSIGYYGQEPPKSLGREFVDSEILPLFGDDADVECLMSTYAQHIAFQISKVLNALTQGDVLVTGGGAYNTYLIDLLKERTKQNIVVPESTLVDLKEAMIFAFLGALRFCGEANCLKSVTGAKCDNIGGAMYGFGYPEKTF